MASIEIRGSAIRITVLFDEDFVFVEKGVQRTEAKRHKSFYKHVTKLPEYRSSLERNGYWLMSSEPLSDYGTIELWEKR